MPGTYIRGRKRGEREHSLHGHAGCVAARRQSDEFVVTQAVIESMTPALTLLHRRVLALVIPREQRWLAQHVVDQGVLTLQLST